MKPDRRLTQSFILIAFFCALSITSFSQVQELIPTDTASSSELIEVISTDNEEKDTSILVNNEKDSVSRFSVSKPKLNTESGKAEKENEEEDSILSFNFIYYIFKRFKLSDIID